MPVEVRCSNPECNKLLSLPDDAAGEKFRCPGCKSEIDVPAQDRAAAKIAEDVAVDAAAFAEKGVHLARAAPGGPDDADDRQRRARRPGQLAPHEDDKLPVSPHIRRHACTLLNLGQFLVAAALLLGLAFMPLLPWVTIDGEMINGNKKDTSSITITGLGDGAGTLPDVRMGKVVSKNGTLASAGRPEGLLLMAAALVVTLLGLVGFVLAMTGVLGREGSGYVATIATLVLESASVFFLCWQMAWIWKTVTLAEVMRKEGARVQEVGITEPTLSTFPGLGLFIGLGLAAAAGYVFSNLASRITRTLWCRLAELGGLLLGGLVLALLVQAWDAQALWDAIGAL